MMVVKMYQQNHAANISEIADQVGIKCAKYR
jgi:hypothetical protein